MDEDLQPDEAEPEERSRRISPLAIFLLLIAAMLAIALLTSNQGAQPAPDLGIVSQYAQYTGPQSDKCTFTVTVTNFGDATGSKILRCEVGLDNDLYFANEVVTLTPGETRTYTVVVNVPAFSSDGLLNAYLSNL